MNLHFGFINVLHRAEIHRLAQRYWSRIDNIIDIHHSYPLIISPDTSAYLFEEYYIRGTPFFIVDRSSGGDGTSSSHSFNAGSVLPFPTPHSDYYDYHYYPKMIGLHEIESYLLKKLQYRPTPQCMVISIDRPPENICIGEYTGASPRFYKRSNASSYYDAVDAMSHAIYPAYTTGRYAITDLDVIINSIPIELLEHIEIVVDIAEEILYGDTTCHFLNMIRNEVRLED